jgi:hypothetical protein
MYAGVYFASAAFAGSLFTSGMVPPTPPSGVPAAIRLHVHSPAVALDAVSAAPDLDMITPRVSVTVGVTKP